MTGRRLSPEAQARRDAVIHARLVAAARLLAHSPTHRRRALARLAALRWWRT
jgi:hypothetical protein